MERRVKFNRSIIFQSGVIAAMFGVVAYVVATQADLAGSEVLDEFSPLLFLVSPILVVAGIVMIVVGLAANKDEPRLPVDDVALQERTREIMESEGLGLTAAWHRANNETSRPSPRPAQDSPDLEGRLRELKQLHDDGLIDAKEYQRKQRSLLDGL